jgi:hypothetical protein
MPDMVRERALLMYGSTSCVALIRLTILLRNIGIRTPLLAKVTTDAAYRWTSPVINAATAVNADKSHELRVYAFTDGSILLNVLIDTAVTSMPADIKSITENAWIQFFICPPSL